MQTLASGLFYWLPKKYLFKLPEYKYGDIISQVDFTDPGKCQFYDETWSRVVNRWEDRNKISKGIFIEADDTAKSTKGIVVNNKDGICKIKGKPNVKDEWIYLHVPLCEKNYSWSLSVRKLSDFKELQFGFR